MHSILLKTAIQNGSHLLLEMGLNVLDSSLKNFKHPVEVKAGLIAKSYNKVSSTID